LLAQYPNLTVTIVSGETNDWTILFASTAYIMMLVFFLVLNWMILVYTIAKMIMNLYYGWLSGKKMSHMLFKELSIYVYYITIVGRALCIFYYTTDPFSSNGVLSEFWANILSTIFLPASFFCTLILALTLNFSMSEIRERAETVVYRKTLIAFVIVAGLIFAGEIIISLLRSFNVHTELDLVILCFYYILFPLAIVIFFVVVVVKFQRISLKTIKDKRERKLIKRFSLVSRLLVVFYSLFLVAVMFNLPHYENIYLQVLVFFMVFISGTIIDFIPVYLLLLNKKVNSISKTSHSNI